ncbi:MAG: proline--tRNA ligase [Candidatus Margulisiibacteriota bacterium]
MNNYRNCFINTVKESPRDAEVISHQLMVRAGLIKKLASGIYSILPLGLRIFSKLNAIIRDEMDAIGGVECQLPCAIPAELWETSGRWDQYGKELLRFEDRQGRSFCFGPTHEEVITDLVSSFVNSYKQLPLLIYQIQTKFRDEIRPRFGLMRCREFLMKDAYSFHDSEASLDDMYQHARKAYQTIFERCGLTFVEAVADSGAIGGDVSAEFLVVAPSGEDEVLVNNAAGFAANIEACESIQQDFQAKVSDVPIQMVETPNQKTMSDVASFLKTPLEQCIKSMLIMVEDQPYLVCIPGDRDLNESKLGNYFKAPFRFATDQEVLQFMDCVPGFIGPVGSHNVPVLCDYSLGTHSDYCAGANQNDQHFIHVCIERDIPTFEWADLKNAMAGDPCPIDPSLMLESMRGIEVGHVFKLGLKYADAMGAQFNDSNGKRKSFQMGCYGIGVGRTIAAAIEQSHDEQGIIWPEALAPFHVVIVHLCPKDDEMNQLVTELVQRIEGMGKDVIVDDRNESPGVKFNDADLIGFPYQIVIGRKVMSANAIEIKQRRTGDLRSVSLDRLDELNKVL